MSFRGYFSFPFYSLFNTFWVLKLESKIVSKKSQKSTIFGFRKNWPFFDHFLMSFRGCFLFPFYSLFNTFWVLKLEPKIVSKKSQKSTIFGLRENWPSPEPQNWSFFDHFLMSFRGYFLFPFYSLFNTFWVLKLELKIVSKKSQKSTISKIDNFWFLGGHFVEAKKFKNAFF